MLVIGLTGGIASGKSTVSNLLKSYQIPIIDLDQLSREVVQPGSSALRAIQTRFSDSILDPDHHGHLNRLALSKIIFSDPIQRQWLNSLLHPLIFRLMIWKLFKAWIQGHKRCILDAPLLIETGLWKFCGKVIVVYCSQPIQINRLKSRNHLNSTESISIIQSQSTLSQKLNHADYVLENSGTLIDLESQVQRLVWKLEKIHSRLIWFLSWWILPFGLLNGLLTILWRLYVQRIGSHHRKQPNLNSNTGSTSSTSISRP